MTNVSLQCTNEQFSKLCLPFCCYQSCCCWGGECVHIHMRDGWHAGIAAAQWLALRLQTIAAFVISLVALLAVLGHEALLPFAVRDDKFAASKSSLLNVYCVVVLHANLLCCMPDLRSLHSRSLLHDSVHACCKYVRSAQHMLCESSAAVGVCSQVNSGLDGTFVSSLNIMEECL